MLILDAFYSHATEKIKKQVAEMNTDLVIIPGGMTSQLQVLDVVINKPFRVYLGEEYSHWLINGNHALPSTGKLKKPSIQLLAQWITTAWGRISIESIKL